MSNYPHSVTVSILRVEFNIILKCLLLFGDDGCDFSEELLIRVSDSARQNWNFAVAN